jgi:hypothetical protein
LEARFEEIEEVGAHEEAAEGMEIGFAVQTVRENGELGFEGRMAEIVEAGGAAGGRAKGIGI